MSLLGRLLPLGIGLALLSAGCEKADPSTAAYWIERIKTDQRRQAIKQLGKMEKPGDAAVKALMAAYKEGRHPLQIISALAQIGDKQAIPTLLAAIQDNNEEGAGKLAASTLLDWEVGAEVDTYVKVIDDKTTPNKTAHGVLKIMSKYPDPRYASVLLKLLENDPDIRPIILNGLAAEILGKLKEPRAVPKLVECLWLDDHLHRNAVTFCRLALNRIGPVAVPELLKTLERKNRAVEVRARKYKYHRGGLIEAKCAELLGDLGSPEAVDLLIAAYQKEEEMPVSYQADPLKSKAFSMGQVQKLISAANALGVIGDERAVEPFLARLDVKGSFREIIIATVQQLGFLGSSKAIPGLLKRMDEEPDKLDPDGHGLRIQMSINALNSIDASDKKQMAKFEKAIKGYKAKLADYAAELRKQLDEKVKKEKHKAYTPYFKAYKDWEKAYTDILLKVDAIRECKKDAACWEKKLAAPAEAIHMLAAYRLAQLKEDPKGAVKALLTQAGTQNMTLRNVVFFGLDRLATAEILPALQKVRKADQELALKDKRYTGAVYTTDLLMAKLSHRKN